MLPRERFEDCIELALGFVSNPWNFYQNGGLHERLAVLKLAFAEPLRCSLAGVYGTPNFSFPFRYLSENSGEESEMVRVGRLELPRLAAEHFECPASTVPPHPRRRHRSGSGGPSTSRRRLNLGCQNIFVHDIAPPPVSGLEAALRCLSTVMSRLVV